jgi:hypothetical protein
MLKCFAKKQRIQIKLKKRQMQLKASCTFNSIIFLICSKGSSDSDSGSSSHNYNQNNIDFGHSILTNSSLDDEFNFDRLGPFEKLCSLCDNPTPSNM